jgi:cyclohexyl-isocyanide hydratase
MSAPLVLMVAFPGMQPLDFVGPYEAFRAGGVDIAVAGEEVGSVRIDEHFSIRCGTEFTDGLRAEALFVPGGPGVTAQLENDALLRFLNRSQCSWITSVCTGSLLLAAAGLLKGYRATTHWRYVDLLPLGGAIPVSGERIVVDRNRVTGGGITAGLDFALSLVAMLRDESDARLAQLGLEYAPSPPYEGTPELARPETVARYREETRERYELRKAEFVDAVKRMSITA